MNISLQNVIPLMEQLTEPSTIRTGSMNPVPDEMSWIALQKCSLVICYEHLIASVQILLGQLTEPSSKLHNYSEKKFFIESSLQRTTGFRNPFIIRKQVGSTLHRISPSLSLTFFISGTGHCGSTWYNETIWLNKLKGLTPKAQNNLSITLKFINFGYTLSKNEICLVVVWSETWPRMVIR